MKIKAFDEGVETCRSQTGVAACTCWSNAALGVDVETIKKCTRKSNLNYNMFTQLSNKVIDIPKYSVLQLLLEEKYE